MIDLNLKKIYKKIERFKKLIISAYYHQQHQKIASLTRILCASRSFKRFQQLNSQTERLILNQWRIEADFKRLFKHLRTASFENLIQHLKSFGFQSISKYRQLVNIKRWAKRKHSNKSWSWIKSKYQFNQLFTEKPYE